MTAKKPKPPKHNWTNIERDWRAGVLSHADICRKYGLNEAYLRKVAKRKKWTKDLKEQIRTRALTVLRTLEEDGERVRQEAGHDPRTDEDVIDDAVRTQLETILGHRKKIREAQEIAGFMLEELRAVTLNQAMIAEMIDLHFEGGAAAGAQLRAMLKQTLSVGNRATVLVNLSNALGRLTALERQAFGLEEKSTKDPVKVDAEKVVQTDGRTDLERAAAVLNMVERAARAKATTDGPETVQ